MSSKATKKNAVSKTNEILTRTKAAQQNRQLRAKNKKTVKPVENEPSTKPKKSTKIEKSDSCCKDTPLKNKVRQLVQLVEQVEYHPDKLKRDLSIKKILLKPKPNFKVIASANKRKLGVPQKGGVSQIPLKKCRSSTKTAKRDSFCEMSMPDIVRLIEDTQSLSDEDFMEILTCPSPVWWEDPPDDEYIEDAIFKRTPTQSSPTISSTDENNGPEEQTDKQTNTSTDTQTSNHGLIDFESEIEEFKITSKEGATNTSNNMFKAKKQKLENVLGNIKNVKSCKKDANEVKIINANEVKDNEMKKNIDVEKPRRLSTSTDGEDFSDLSFNEEEVLKNLENIQIPIEQTQEQNDDKKIEVDIIGTETKIKKGRSPRKKIIPVPIKKELSMPRITVKKFARKPITDELIVPDKMPPLTRKPDIKIEKSENADSADYLDNLSLSSFKFISDDDVSLIDDKDRNSSCIETTDEIKEENEIKNEQIDTASATGINNKVFFRKKVIKDLSEYITVYKIMSHDNEKNAIDNEKLNKNAENTNNVSGKLNTFFKKRKSNKRVIKSDSSFPANSLTAVKDLLIDNKNRDEKSSVVNDENRLKECDCVVKTENGLACDSCNFHMDKEVGKNHVSSCKDVARIPWNHNYLTNQT